MDSYITHTGYIAYELACFGSLKVSNKAPISILLEAAKVGVFGREKIYRFLDYLKESGCVDFTVEDYSDDIIKSGLKITFHPELEMTTGQLKYAYTAIRCLYDPHTTDKVFRILAENFIQMCDAFKDADRGLLMCIAINNLDLNYDYYRDIHFFVSECESCEMLTAEEIRTLTKKNSEIHKVFTRLNKSIDYDKIDELCLGKITEEKVSQILNIINNVSNNK